MMGGNGSAKRIIKEVDKLPIQKIITRKMEEQCYENE